MKPFIDLCVELRKKAKEEKNKFGENFFKLMPNSGFGKTIQNDRNNIKIDVGHNWNFEKLVKRVTFKNRTILNENVSLVQFKNLTQKMNKPIIIGASILEIAKVEIYKFYYDYRRLLLGYKR